MGGGEERLRQGCGGGHGGGGHRDGGEGRGSDGEGGGDGGIEDGFVVVVERCSTVLENSIAVIKKKWFMLAAKWYFDYLHSIACSFFTLLFKVVVRILHWNILHGERFIDIKPLDII